MVKKLILTLAAMLLASVVAAEPVINVATGIEFPDSIAGYERVGVNNFETQKPGLGYSYVYRTREGITASVYVFNLQLERVPDNVADPQIEAIRKMAADEVILAAKMRGSSAEKTFSITDRVKTSRGLVNVDFDMFRTHGPTFITFTWIWTARNHIFKIRLTPSPMVDTEHVRDFSDAIVRLSVE